MNEPLFMGIDGGGSTLRVAIVNADLNELSMWTGESVNPSIVGRGVARERIQTGVLEALQLADLHHERLAAVGIGIAGASDLHSRQWLIETANSALPLSQAVPSSDLEIALVGALAQRHGLLLLAGTGSAAYVRRPDGKRLQVGGWGYLLGDEGSSFWIGSQLLRHFTATYDSGAEAAMTATGRACLDHLCLSRARDLVAWVYRSESAPAVRIASLAPFVLDLAESGDTVAIDIVSRAAKHLTNLAETTRRRLAYRDAPIAFAGGLLENANWLSAEVARRLGLPKRPVAKYPPVKGAALLAKMEWSARRCQ